MAILKCKMCGGDIELSADKTFGTCEFCGSTMTFPKVDDEQRAAAFNRGNHFRRIGEFDKALAVYERIVQEDENDAEAHWCCALCRFGIEYVEDPNTFEYLPTCHRASFDSFLEDVDYLAALEHSDGITRRQYQKDAAKIAEVQRGILATSQNEEPFDVFICYKESEDDGRRTRDSLYAQDIYYQLTEQGRRVFFSRITLEDKAGTEYEPYIFAALNSAKVMILVTTSAEHANAVWVKNEWSRFLSLMRKDRTKLLLPCYRDMDPYDLPEALSVLQSYDMSKIGFIQDLIRGVNKVLEGSKPKQAARETVVVQQQSGHAAPLLERAFMFLEDGDWAKADDFCEQVLNLEPKNALAYLGKLMAELKVRKREALKDCDTPFDDLNNYQKALRFADSKLKTELSGVIAFINDRNETARKEGIYQNALAAMDRGEVADYREAARLFDSISDYKDSAQKAQECREQAVILPKENAYRAAIALMANGYENDFRHAAEQFRRLSGYKDADAKVQECLEKAEIARKENIYTTCKQVLARRQTPQGNWAEAIGTFYVPSKGEAYERWFNSIKGFESIAEYKDSSELAEQCREKLYALLTNELETSTDVETLTGVSESFVKMGDYKEAREKAQACLEKRENCRKQLLYSDAVKTMNGAGFNVDKLELAIRKLASVAGWQNTDELVETCRRRIEQIKAQEEAARQEAKRQAEAARLEAERKAEAECRAEIKKKKRQRAFVILFVILGLLAVAAFFYWNNVMKPQQAYNQAVELFNAGRYEDAITAFETLNDYHDSITQIRNCNEAILSREYNKAKELYETGSYYEAIKAYKSLNGYLDSNSQVEICETAIKEQDYSAALSLLNSGEYEKAISAFSSLNGYKDSNSKIQICETRILDRKYDSAKTLYDNGQFEKAISAFEALNGYKDSTTLIKDSKYYIARALFEKGNYKDSIVAFRALKGYKDSNKQQVESELLLLQNAKEGSTVYFGEYEQDNSTSNGKESIEWIVIAKKGTKVLIISKKALDYQKYNTSSKVDVTWETSSVRKWLNSSFFNSSFNSEEKALIKDTTVTADKNPQFNTAPGKNTTDKVFLLSITEAETYLKDAEKLKCSFTDYIRSKDDGSYIFRNDTCEWWLRTPGQYAYLASSVLKDGKTYQFGRDASIMLGIRPALWLDIG